MPLLALAPRLGTYACIGNHEIWGWDKASRKTTGDEANWGKRRSTDMLHLDDHLLRDIGVSRSDLHQLMQGARTANRRDNREHV